MQADHISPSSIRVGLENIHELAQIAESMRLVLEEEQEKNLNQAIASHETDPEFNQPLVFVIPAETLPRLIKDLKARASFLHYRGAIDKSAFLSVRAEQLDVLTDNPNRLDARY